MKVVAREDLRNTELLPFLKPTWARGQDRHVPAVSATEVFSARTTSIYSCQRRSAWQTCTSASTSSTATDGAPLPMEPWRGRGRGRGRVRRAGRSDPVAAWPRWCKRTSRSRALLWPGRHRCGWGRVWTGGLAMTFTARTFTTHP